MTEFYLGADLGGTKTHVMIAEDSGRCIGFGESGPGNHESVGYDGFQANLDQAVVSALRTAGLTKDQINGSGFGVAGYDWPIEKEPTLNILNKIGLSGAIELVNDAELGLLAGSPRLWGVAVVSGTGCNCRGWDAERKHFGRVTGGGVEFGENAGASELMFKVSNALGAAWTGRGPATALAEAFSRKYGVADLTELLQGLICHNFGLDAADAPLVFEVARQGDPVAVDLVRWAGRELGEMACSVIRQLNFQMVDFDLVLIGGMWDGSPLLTDELKNLVLSVAPDAKIIRTHEPPVLGAVLLGMEAAGLSPTAEQRNRLIQTLPLMRK
jgi:N-acetylglucosamine kinase-like BadF-type ATPase